MTARRARICVVAATPLTLHFFFRPHLAALCRDADVTLVCNFEADAYLPPLDLPVNKVSVAIERKITPLCDLRALWQLIRVFRVGRFDLVVTVVPKAGLLGMLAAVCCGIRRRVHIFQGEVWASCQGGKRLLLKSIDRLIVMLSTHRLAVSPSERDFLAAQGVARPGTVTVLGCGSIVGVDVQRFVANPEARRRLRRAWSIPEEGVVCLFLGRVTQDKGVLDLVDAFAACGPGNPALWLVVAGPDEEGLADSLRDRLTSSLRERLVVEGFVPRPEEALAAADFLCLPSYREGFGMVVIEAAAVGIPSIGTRIYGVSDAVEEDRTGLLVPPGDVGALAATIDLMGRDDVLRARLASAARERVLRDFEQAGVVRRYVNYLSGLLS